MFSEMTSGARNGLLLSILAGVISGCGVVYTPQEFEKSVLTYGYKGDLDVAIEVIPLTFTVARAANSDGYTPRTLPSAFAEAPPETGGSVRDRLTQSGLYTVAPPLVFETPPAGVPYANDQIVPAPQRNENVAPLTYPAPAFLPLPEIGGGTTGGGYIQGSGAVPYGDAGVLQPATLQVQGASSSSVPSARRTPFFETNADLDVLLDRPESRQAVQNNPLPFTQSRTYRIGPGDIIGLQNKSDAIALAARELENDLSIASQQSGLRLLVQDNGEIFVPQVGSIYVKDMTLDQARQMINDRLLASGQGLNVDVQIVKFGSQRIAISGLTKATSLPVAIRSVTLGEAIVAAGGFGPYPENTVVRVLRDGAIYKMTGDFILASDELTGRVLLGGDLVAITNSYDADAATAYFDQQLRLREVDRSNFSDQLAASEQQRAEERMRLERERFSSEQRQFEANERRADAQVGREQAADARADARTRLERTNLELSLRGARLESDRLLWEAEIARLEAQRTTDLSNEEARLANIEARQVYLERLRTLEGLNREAMRQAREESRAVQVANQSERIRARADQLELLELELRQEQARLERQMSARQQSQDLFNQRLTLDAVARDYITIAGETKTQTTMPLPFDTPMTLNRLLYGKAEGIDLISGDASEIYIIRTPDQSRIQDKIIAYHLNASNPAALAVASIFEMRPNDVVFVNPQPITKWNRVLTQILPSTGLVQSGITAATGITN